MKSKDIIELLNTSYVKNKLSKFNITKKDKLIIINNKNKFISKLYNDKILSKLIYKSNKYDDFIIVKFNSINKNKNYLFEILFINTGYRDIVQYSQIRTGDVKDFRYKSVCGIGYLGDKYKDIKQSDHELCLKLRYVWKDMINRCYNKKNKRYKDYGKIGITVSDRWLCFSNFYYDIISNKTFNREKLLDGELSLDKDKLQKTIKKSKRIYDKDTCLLLPSIEQYKYSDIYELNESRKIRIKYYNTITHEEDIVLGVNNLSRLLNVDVTGIYSVLSGRCKTCHNYIFSYVNDN